MTPDELLAAFEKQALLRPESPTAAILVDIFDEYRKEIDRRAFGIQALNASVMAQNDAAYRYAIARYRTDERGQRYYTGTYRFTDAQLHTFARDNNLEYGKLLAVAIGEREMYKGYIQGEFIRFTYGKKYNVYTEDSKEPDIEKWGAWGLFRHGIARFRDNDE